MSHILAVHPLAIDRRRFHTCAARFLGAVALLAALLVELGLPGASFAQAPLSVIGSVSPRQGSYVGSFTFSASASGGDAASTRFAYFRRRPGGTWIPSINAPTWTASTTYSWSPTLSDVGVWETYIWVKDASTPPTANTYGYAAGVNSQPIEVFGPPTVPGATTVSCAYSSGGECWVTGDFTASVSPSTGGLGSLVYQICRSVDSSGAFAGCDVNLTLTGGTSITVSGGHLPSDGYRRAYYFQARDSAGAYSGWNSPLLVRIDRYAPSLGASNASDTWYSSRTATISASDSGSGLQAVRYSWGSALNASCTTGSSTSSGATLTTPAGDNFLYLCAKDNTGRVAQWSGRYRIAPMTLSGSVNPNRASYLASFTWTMSAGGGTPASTRYAFFRRRPGGTWIPDVNSPTWTASNSYTWNPALADVGTWETYVWVKDGDTPANANTYGYAAGLNTLPIEVVGKPTVPGATTVACAYATGDDCWVTGDFTASVTASTGGMGSLVYDICRSVDSSGGFAGCDATITLTGGASILVSGAHLASDGYRRAYYFQAKDSAGAASGWNVQRYVRVDRYAPAVSASNASDSWFPSRTATVSASDVTVSAAANSGLQGVRYAWNTALDAACTNGAATSSGATLTAPSGDNLLYLCAKDNTGRVTQWNGRYRVAAPLALTGTVTPTRGSYLSTFTWTASATGGDPATIRYAFFRRRPGGTWIPDVTTPNWQASNVYSWTPGVVANVGTWETYIWVKDGNTPANQNTYGYAAGYNTGPIEVVGPPTVPGPTTVSCAYSVADDCWVTGDFTASVTASTGGMDSLVYQICRSVDSSGGFAGCDVNLTLTGGTSIAVSGTHLPADGSRRAYYFQAKDSAGALSGWNTQRYVRVDRNAPTVSATNASDLWFSSRTATISAADTKSGVAANSGVQAVRYSWNTALDAGCTTGTATSPGATLTAPGGDNLLYLCVRDNTGRTAQWNGRYRVAAMALTGSVSPTRASYLGTFTWTASATGGDPATTRYAFFRRPPGGTWIPSVNAPNWQAAASYSWTPALADVGTWETYIWVKDGDTPADANTYGYAAGFNTGPIEVVGKPTVPGPTTVSCAYAAENGDCWVPGDFTAEVAESSGGMGSLAYQICRSVDSASGFAGCDVNLTLTGGTSILVSGAHLPGDGYRRAFYFQAKDAAGALSGWNTPRSVRVDRNPPGVSATNASDQWFTSRSATISAADDVAGSGLLELRYAWNTPLGASCDTGTATATGTTLTAPEGDNFLYLCARDRVGRVTQWNGRYRVTTELILTGVVTPSRASYLDSFTWGATAVGGDPATTRYAFFRRPPGGTWIPDIENPTWQDSPVYVWHPTLEDVGTWETYIWAKDGQTPPDAHGYGFAAGYNTGPIEVVGPPTVPGPTTVSCASSTGDDCWVQGDFTASVTSSTGGMEGLTYQVCRSNDSPGGTVACDVTLALAGGTSIAISGSDLPGDGYRRAYSFQARDSAGALSGWNTPRHVRVDRHTPSVSATNASDEWFPSRTGTISATDEAGGAASNSGLLEARYSWNTLLDAACTSGTVVGPGATLTAPNGDNLLYLCARDNAGRVGQWNGRYRVGEAPDFLLDLTPPAATVVKGGSAQFTIALSAGSTFTEMATLSVSGLPAGTSHTLQPAAIGVGDTTALSVTTTTNTPQGTYAITVTATAGDLIRTAEASLTVRPPFAPGDPVVDSISPEVFDGGVVKTITILGRNFQGATVTVAEEDPDPDNPTNRIFPTLGQAIVSADGKRIDVAVDCTEPGVMDFYALVVDNGVGKDASRPFRVIPVGPVVDLITPSRPERGEDNVYVLTLGGYHLRNATVRSEPAGALVIFGVDAVDDSHVNGLLRVPDDAPLGPVDLVVTGSGGHETRVTIEIVAPGAALVVTQKLGTRRLDPLTLGVVEGRSPTVLFQRFAVRQPETTEVTAKGMRVRTTTSMDKLGGGSFSFSLYYQYTLNLLNFTWTRAFVFDPLTDRIGDEVLQGLGLGERVRIGAFVLSFALRVDLTIEVYLTNNGFTWPRFCIEITTAIQIPGTEGFFEQWSYCRGGKWFSFNGGSTDALTVKGGPCAKVTPEGPPVDGELFAEVEQSACCNQPIEVSGTGFSFTGPFDLTTQATGTTTPGPSCTCHVSTPPACLLKDKERDFTATGTPAGGTYQWRVVQGSNRVSVTKGAATNTLTLKGTAASAAADDVELEVVYTNGTSSCAQRIDLSVVEIEAQPSGSTSFLQFLASGQADANNTAGNNPGVGLPHLGLVTPGNPAGTIGYHNNMQIRARIAPCDPNLRCNFDFKRLRQGVLAQIAANGQLDGTMPGHCPAGGCDDDSGNNVDEDLFVDAAPGCSIFVIDTPGINLRNNGACPGANGVKVVSCFDFDEWLEVDGERATPDLKWHSSTRLKCNGTKFVLDSGGAGNGIGLGSISCTPQTAYSVSSPMAAPSAAGTTSLSSPTAIEPLLDIADRK